MLLSLGYGIDKSIIVRDTQSEEILSLSVSRVTEMMKSGAYIKGIYWASDGVNLDVRFYTDSCMRDMIKRCDKSYKKEYEWYEDVTVHEDFRDKFKFFTWYENQQCVQQLQKDFWITDKDSIKIQLDKDLFMGENKIYSPSTCVLLPHYLNALLMGFYGKRDKIELPRGISSKGKNSLRAEFNRSILGLKDWQDSKSISNSSLLRYRDLGMIYSDYYNLNWSDKKASVVGFLWSEWKEAYIKYITAVVRQEVQAVHITQATANKFIERISNLKITD